MATPAHTTQTWRFGVFEVDAQTEELRRAGVPIKLRDQCFRILVLLLEREGQVVTREDLRKALWTADTFVDFDHGLNAAVMKLREVLGDTAEKPLYIETIPKRGYRFICPLKITEREGALDQCELPAVPLQVPAAEKDIARPKRKNRVVITSIAASCLVASVGILWYLLRPPPLPYVTDYIQISRDSYGRYLVGTDGTNLYFWEPPISPRLPWIAISGGGMFSIPVNLVYPRALDVSPDGSHLLVVALGENSVWSVRVSDGSLRHLVNADAISGAWSNDGKMIALLTTAGDFLRMQSDGTDLHTLATLPERSRSPFSRRMAWSPDGRTIRFTRDLRLSEMASDGSSPHPLLPGWRQTAGQCCGQWTPDGRFFMFLSFEPRAVWGTARGAQLFLLDERRTLLSRSNREPIQLTSGPIGWDRPVISKDGRRVFARGTVLHGQLTRYDTQSRQLQPFLGGMSAE